MNAMRILKNFKCDKIYKKNSNHFFIGKSESIPVSIKIVSPCVDSSILMDFIKSKHETDTINDVYSTGKFFKEVEIDMEVIYPFSSNDMKQLDIKYSFTEESYEEYLKNSSNFEKCWLNDAINESFDIQNDIMELKCSKNFEIVLNKEDFLLLKELNNHQKKSLNNFILIFKDPKFKTLRDLDNPQLIKEIYSQVLKYFEEKGIDEQFICRYLNFNPMLKQAHVYFKDISQGISQISSQGGVILFDNFLKNLEINKDYYKGNHFYVKEI